LRLRLFLGFLFVVGIVGAVSFLFSKLVITTDKSVEPFLFWKEGKRELRKGDYVLVKGKGLGEGKLFTKRVMCMEGDEVKRSGIFYYCCSENGSCVFMHPAFLETPKRRKLEPWNPCGGNLLTSECKVRLKEGEYYLGSFVTEGYDSRYLGPFREEEIITVLKPIF
jgi:hypothetical protein